jgi:hypothetical protein
VRSRAPSVPAVASGRVGPPSSWPCSATTATAPGADRSPGTQPSRLRPAGRPAPRVVLVVGVHLQVVHHVADQEQPPAPRALLAAQLRLDVGLASTSWARVPPSALVGDADHERVLGRRTPGPRRNVSSSGCRARSRSSSPRRRRSRARPGGRRRTELDRRRRDPAMTSRSLPGSAGDRELRETPVRRASSDGRRVHRRRRRLARGRRGPGAPQRHQGDVVLLLPVRTGEAVELVSTRSIILAVGATHRPPRRHAGSRTCPRPVRAPRAGRRCRAAPTAPAEHDLVLVVGSSRACSPSGIPVARGSTAPSRPVCTHGRLWPALANTEPPGRGLQDAVEAGDEHVGRHVGDELVVDPLETAPGSTSRCATGPQDAAGGGHHQRGRAPPCR